MQSLEERTVIALESIAYELRRYNDKDKEEKDRIVSCSEAADICRVTRQTISVWIRTGRLNKVYRNGRTGILLSQLDKEINPAVMR